MWDLRAAKRASPRDTKKRNRQLCCTADV